MKPKIGERALYLNRLVNAEDQAEAWAMALRAYPGGVTGMPAAEMRAKRDEWAGDAARYRFLLEQIGGTA